MVPSKRRGGWKRSGAPPRRRRGAPDRRRRRKPGIRSSSTIDTEDARRSEPDRAGWRELRPRTGAAALWFKITVRLENSPALIPDLEVERKVHWYCCNCQGAVVAHMPPFLTFQTHSNFLPFASQSKPAPREQTCFHLNGSSYFIISKRMVHHVCAASIKLFEDKKIIS